MLLPNAPWGADAVAGVAVGGRHTLIWTEKGEVYGMGVLSLYLKVRASLVGLTTRQPTEQL